MLIINYLASIIDNYGDNIFKRFVEGGLPVAALGIITVFSVLTIIWGALELLKYFFYTLPKMREEEGDVEKTPEVTPIAPAQPQAATNDAEIVAAIIAAITAARADEGIPESAKFRVVSFRKRK